jgi:hypothetical protein
MVPGAVTLRATLDLVVRSKAIRVIDTASGRVDGLCNRAMSPSGIVLLRAVGDEE